MVYMREVTLNWNGMVGGLGGVEGTIRGFYYLSIKWRLKHSLFVKQYEAIDLLCSSGGKSLAMQSK